MNPFIDEGSIVFGEKFVGRYEALSLIEDRVVSGLSCLAIVGQGRMGKSSLAYHALVHQRQRLAERRILVLSLNLPSFQNRTDLFRKIIWLAREELEEYAPNLLGEVRVERFLQKTQQGNLEWLDLQDTVQQFFKFLKRREWGAILILDEFDAARTVLRGDLQAFQTLRELAYQPEWRVGLVTLSRRSLEEIEVQSEAISNLHGIFDTYYLPRFSFNELTELVKRVTHAGLSYSPELTQDIYEHTGGHPYLSVKLLSRLVTLWLETHRIDLDHAFEQVQLMFVEYYGELLRLLKEDESDRKLLEVVCGPVIKATRQDAGKLERYQLIQPSGESYQGFSDHFTKYLNAQSQIIDLWEVWKNTECALRDFIINAMQKEYGSVWEENVEAKFSELRPVFEKCRSHRDNARKFLGEQASHRLLDYASPRGYWKIIELHWQHFSNRLGKTKKEWQERFELIKSVRDPMAHNAAHSLHPDRIKQAEIYCRELLEAISPIK